MAAHEKVAAAGPRANPVLVLVIVLPLLAIFASLGSWFLAATRGDSELPAIYHWEGSALATDAARMAAAAQQGISATITVDPATRRCVVQLRGATPRSLRLTLTHPTNAREDQQLLLTRAGADYSGTCRALPLAHWWVDLADVEGRWLLRARVASTMAHPARLDSAGPSPGAAP